MTDFQKIILKYIHLKPETCEARCGEFSYLPVTDFEKELLNHIDQNRKLGPGGEILHYETRAE